MDDAAAPTTPPPPQSAPPVLSPVSDGEGRKEERDPLALPSPEVLKEIARRQELRAKEIRAKRAAALAHGRGQHAAATAVAAGGAGAGDDAQARDAAAALIQKNYRGYRERRAMSGWGLDPSTRWMEALKEAKYSNATRPKSRRQSLPLRADGTLNSSARQNWRRVATITQRVGSDDTSSDEEEEGLTEEQKAIRVQRRKEKKDRDQFAKIMGLEYFLEAVDQKHRYGSNLRRYHVEWKKADTHENFFYWLDYGEGKELDLEDRPRARLDREQVRYLSREERQKYSVRIDPQGRFRLAKNDMLITTSAEYRDSINGIVPISDDTPTWREVTTGVKPEPSPPSSEDDASSLSSIGRGSSEDDSKYTNDEFRDAKGVHKLQHVSVNSLMNHLLRKTTRKNTWIFVADTSFRMYIGIKQSGAFQHSSFLHGARVSAAGLIKIKRGQVRKISPLSGHYAPPLKNFREFVKSLNAAGADMSHCSISRSYAILLGLEGYLGAKRHVKTAEQGLKDLINPDEKRKRDEAAKDKSESAKREREFLDRQERLRKESSRRYTLARRLGFKDGHDATVDEQHGGKGGDGGVAEQTGTVSPIRKEKAER